MVSLISLYAFGASTNIERIPLLGILERSGKRNAFSAAHARRLFLLLTSQSQAERCASRIIGYSGLRRRNGQAQSCEHAALMAKTLKQVGFDDQHHQCRSEQDETGDQEFGCASSPPRQRSDDTHCHTHTHTFAKIPSIKPFTRSSVASSRRRRRRRSGARQHGPSH